MPKESSKCIFNSFDQVQKAVEYLQVIYLNVDMDSAPLVIQNLNTLVEVTIGNRCNQGVIFDAKIVDIINHLIRQPNYGDCTAEIVADVKESAVLLASTLLEENGVEAARLAKDVTSKMCFFQYFFLKTKYSYSSLSSWISMPFARSSLTSSTPCRAPRAALDSIATRSCVASAISM